MSYNTHIRIVEIIDLGVALLYGGCLSCFEDLNAGYLNSTLMLRKCHPIPCNPNTC